MEDANPGIWQKWFKLQCVTDGHPPQQGFHTNGEDENTKKVRKDKGWARIKKALNEIKPGHKIVAKLPGNRIGRIGEVYRNETTKDEWKPLYQADETDPEYEDWSKGFMGRRILVRWDLEHGPDSPDMVVQLPKGFLLGGGELHPVRCKTVKDFEKEMDNQANWVGLVGGFAYESALSDFIAQYPHRLKDGLEPYPNQKKIREKVFDDDSRADVLLLDGNRKPVIVECKQNSPIVEDVQQLRGYIGKLKEETRQQASGILVHGGARTVDEKVWHEAEISPRVELEIFQYKVDVEFAPSHRAT